MRGSRGFTGENSDQETNDYTHFYMPEAEAGYLAMTFAKAYKVKEIVVYLKVADSGFLMGAHSIHVGWGTTLGDNQKCAHNIDGATVK